MIPYPRLIELRFTKDSPFLPGAASLNHALLGLFATGEKFSLPVYFDPNSQRFYSDAYWRVRIEGYFSTKLQYRTEKAISPHFIWDYGYGYGVEDLQFTATDTYDINMVSQFNDDFRVIDYDNHTIFCGFSYADLATTEPDKDGGIVLVYAYLAPLTEAAKTRQHSFPTEHFAMEAKEAIFNVFSSSIYFPMLRFYKGR